MNNEKLGNALKCIKYHSIILAKGFLLAVYCTLVAGLLFFAGLGFYMVTSEGGYSAVVDFFAACFLLAIALGSVYMLGSSMRRVEK